MTCRHSAYDPNCSSYKDRLASLKADYQREVLSQVTPDAENFEIEEHAIIGKHLVLKVKYPNCKKCSYEGMKVMVFLHCDIGDAIKWRKIDPHFRASGPVKSKKEAPGPNARFPASPEGWQDAIDYATKAK